MIKKSQLDIIEPFRVLPIKYICCTKPHKHTYTSLICSQTPLSGISGQLGTAKVPNRQKTAPTDIPRHQKRTFESCVAVNVDVELCLLGSDLMVSVSVLKYPEM